MTNVAQQIADRKPEVIETENVNWNSRPVAYVTITGPDKYGQWNWQRHTATSIYAGSQPYRSADVAAVAAAIVARCYGVAALLPRSTRPAIVTYYRKQGKVRYQSGDCIEACRNEFERLGFTLARLEAARVPTEIDTLNADLEAFRSGLAKPLVVLTDGDLEAADREWLHTDPRC